MAEDAVKDGDDTLKKANHTYNLLLSFQDEVTKSEVTAQAALKNVNDIEEKLQATEDLIQEAENVSFYMRRKGQIEFFKIFYITNK